MDSDRIQQIEFMKRVPNVILYVITPKTSPVPSVLTHHQFANRIPCLQQDLFQSNMVRYVEKEMESYPIVKEMSSQKLKEDEELTRHKRCTSTQLMKYAYDIINQTDYLIIEEIRQVLHNLNDKEIRENEVTLQMLKKSVSECITRKELDQYQVIEIEALLFQINQIQNKRSSKVV